ncbi:MAG: hypothetical protein NC924_06415 [Candidatus Omnitrophica bacterium]|nr:hypothetical protein [Candidatus Omnitrophota bacterium]
MRWLIVGGIAAFWLFQVWANRPVAYGPGVLAPEEPRQKIYAASQTVACNGYNLKLLASFDITAKVLSRRTYHGQRGDELSPLDLALGWGPMSDESILKDISISQYGRWYHWHVRQFPIPRREIEKHSANMHLIPATPELSRALQDIRTGQIVTLRGYLVEVTAPDGWRWRSSLSREDTGAHSCEVMYVESLE